MMGCLLVFIDERLRFRKDVDECKPLPLLWLAISVVPAGLLTGFTGWPKGRAWQILLASL